MSGTVQTTDKEDRIGQHCFLCFGPCVWDNDFSYDDCGFDGDGIVSMWHCADCGAEYEIRISLEETE